MLSSTEQNPLGDDALKSAARKNRKSESPSVMNEEIPGSPFRMVGTPGKYRAVIGSYALTDWHETPEIVMQWINENQYRVITTMITAVVNQMSMEAQKAMQKDFEKMIADNDKTNQQ